MVILRYAIFCMMLGLFYFVYRLYLEVYEFPKPIPPVKVIDLAFKLDGGTMTALFQDSRSIQFKIGVDVDIDEYGTTKKLYHNNFYNNFYSKKIYINACSHKEIESRAFFSMLLEQSEQSGVEVRVASHFIRFIDYKRIKNNCSTLD